jgi:hypothetical protein
MGLPEIHSLLINHAGFYFKIVDESSIEKILMVLVDIHY